jgi:hypothetical protein
MVSLALDALYKQATLISYRYTRYSYKCQKNKDYGGVCLTKRG